MNLLHLKHLSFLLLLSFSLNAQITKVIKADFWTNFEGTLGETYIHMSLFHDLTKNKVRPLQG